MRFLLGLVLATFTTASAVGPTSEQARTLFRNLWHKPATTSRRSHHDNLAMFRQTEQKHHQEHRNLQQDDQLLASLPMGIWMTRGYGYVIQVTQEEGLAGLLNRTTVALLEETAVSCIFLTDSLVDAGVASIELLDDNTTAVFDVGTNVPYIADKIDAFQGACAMGETEPDGTVLQDFDVIVQTFTEHYAYFRERGIDDWEGLVANARTNLLVNATDQDLIMALESILQPLQDAHVYAYNEELDAEVESKPNSLLERLFDEFANQTTVTDPFDYANQELILALSIVDEYFAPYGGLQWGELDNIAWGSIFPMDDSTNTTKIGYILLLTFGPDDEDLDAYLEDWRAALAFVQDADALIIDTRINGGGSDVLAVFAASHFVATKTLAYTLQPVDGKGGLVEPPALVYMDPAKYEVDIDFLDKPVVLLQSEISVSAAETFALSMIQLPTVTTVGKPTAGAFSDTLVRFTPNGWEFGLSNEYVRAPNGDVYEAVGIPADIATNSPVFSAADRQAGVDRWFEVAFDTAVMAATATFKPTQSPTTAEPTQTPTTKAPTRSPVTKSPVTESPSSSSGSYHAQVVAFLATSTIAMFLVSLI